MSATTQHSVSQMTTYELAKAKRDLAASMALAAPGSPVRASIERELAAIDAEESERASIRRANGGSGYLT